jgi:hypothetical protein
MTYLEGKFFKSLFCQTCPSLAEKMITSARILNSAKIGRWLLIVSNKIMFSVEALMIRVPVL